MRILIIEDAERKLEHIRQFLVDTVGATQIEERRSYASGIAAAIECSLDLIILDMTLPNFDVTTGDSASEMFFFAGRDILHELKRKGISCPVVVITQFPEFGRDSERMTLSELKKELESLFSDSYLGTIYYHPSKVEWQSELISMLTDRGVIREGN